MRDGMTSKTGCFFLGGLKRFAWVAIVLVLVACGEAKQEDEYKLIGCLVVEGTCRENHVQQSGEYCGEIVHWYNVTQNRHDISGFVTDKNGFKVDKMIDEIENPFKYNLPFIIELNNIPLSVIAEDDFVIGGLSENMIDEEKAVYYESTCQLHVLKRLDHIPTQEESKQIGCDRFATK